MKKSLTITLEKAKELYKSSTDEAFKKLLEENFGESLKERKYPTKWEELKEVEGFYITGYGGINSYKGFPVYTNKNVCTHQEFKEAYLALTELTQYYKAWREIEGGELEDNSYAVYVVTGEGPKVGIGTTKFNFFNFLHLETANLFKATFINLLQQLEIFKLL